MPLDFLIATDKGEYRYSTDPARLVGPDGERVDLSRFAYRYLDGARSDSGQTPFSPESPVGKRADVRVLKIQLGLGCNYACSYCSQGGQTEEATSTLDAEAFSLEWVEGRPQKVEFWGGEPLLYWRKLQAIVPKVLARWPGMRVSLVTNGTLLTADRVDWLLEHGFTIGVSHDGPGQHLRGPDPFDSPEQAASLRYAFHRFGDRASILCVLTAANHDLAALPFWFEDRFGFAVKVNVEDVVTDYGGASLTTGELERIGASVRETVSSGLALFYPRIRWAVQQFMESMVVSKPLMGGYQVCGMDRPDQIAVDVAGNVLTCQNAGAESGHKIGTVSALESVALNTSTSYMNRPHCLECPVVHLCYGSCMFLGGKEFESSCHASYHYNLAILAGVVKLLTGAEVRAVSGWKPEARRVIPIKVST